MGDSRMKWTDAWQQLVYQHSPFRAAEVADFQRLLRQLGEFEHLLLANTALTSYANELTGSTPPTPSPAPSGSPVSEVETSPDHLVRHVAAIQLKLMEDAFYSLRLDRHANAPDNRGWMNLFRRWAASPTFRRHLEQLKTTVPRRFGSFYDDYIQGWMEDVPVPHPWDVSADARKVARGGESTFASVTEDALRTCRERAEQKPKGIFLDPGLVEAGDQDSSDEPARVKPGEHGTSEPSPSSAPAPPPAGSEDSSKSTD